MSKRDDIEAFLKEGKISYRETDSHFNMNCFICGESRERLGIVKDTGQWKCFKCDSYGGKLSTLVYAGKHKTKIITKDKIEKSPEEKKCKIPPQFHEQFRKKLTQTKKYKSAAYLVKQRKISVKTIKHFQLGARKLFKNKKKENYDAGEHLVIPYLQDGICVNVKYRSLDPKVEKKWKWRREEGGITALFNDSAIDNLDYDHIFICESEIDCMSLWELGIENVVGLTAGAKSFKPAWYDRLKRFKKVYLVLDLDEAGQEGAEILARRLGMGRCYNVTLPDDVKDPNDFIKKYNKKDFDKLADQAVRFEIHKAKNLGQIIDEIYEERIVKKEESISGEFKTPWPKMNRIIGDPKRGYLWVLAGKPKSGKTSFALNLMHFWGRRKKNRVRTGIYTCEMRDTRIGEKLVMLVTRCLEKIEEVTALDLSLAKLRGASKFIHTYYPTEQEELDVDAVVEKTEEMVQRYGLGCMVIDNLHYLCRGDDENALVSQATQKFKLMAERNDILVILITHPRKTNNNRQLKLDDLKGSSSIFQDADLITLQFRPFFDGDMMPDEAGDGVTEGSMSPRTDFTVTGRFTEGGKTFLAFHGRRALFKDRGTLYRQLTKELGKSKKKKTKGL